LHACGVFAHVWCVEADLEFFLKGIVLERGEGGTLMNNTQHVQIVLHRIEALCTSVEAVMQSMNHAEHRTNSITLFQSSGRALMATLHSQLFYTSVPPTLAL